MAGFVGINVLAAQSCTLELGMGSGLDTDEKVQFCPLLVDVR